MADVPETVLGSPGCKRADKYAEEGGESAGSWFTARQGRAREWIRREWMSEEKGLEASDWPAESRFGRQGLGCPKPVGNSVRGPEPKKFEG